MNFLIIGSGTIGLTYAWLLSSNNNVSVYVPPEKIEKGAKWFNFSIDDFRPQPAEITDFIFHPHLVYAVENLYEAVIVCVNRHQLKNVLPLLKDFSGQIIFMMNHWNIQAEVSNYFEENQYLIGFPSQIGGGRYGNHINAIIFDEDTILADPSGSNSQKLQACTEAFTKSGLRVCSKDNIANWLKVHYLQQSVTAGAIIKAGGYTALSKSHSAVREMILAYKEGISLCKHLNIDTANIEPAAIFKYPALLLTPFIKNMLSKPQSEMMIRNHMNHGITEWITGYYEILEEGLKNNLPMTVWHSYKKYVDEYIHQKQLIIPTKIPSIS